MGKRKESFISLNVNYNIKYDVVLNKNLNKFIYAKNGLNKYKEPNNVFWMLFMDELGQNIDMIGFIIFARLSDEILILKSYFLVNEIFLIKLFF